jgi:hypothetical protein
VGTAIIDQYLGQSARGERQVHQMMMDIAFGEGEVQRHDDREDDEEMVEEGEGEWLGRSSVEGVGQTAVVEALRALSAQLRSGQVAVGEGQAAIELDQVRLGWGHVFMPGGSDKVELNLQWSNTPPPGPQAQPEPGSAGPQYSEEPGNMPIAEFAQLLQRIATEILEDGTFMLEGGEITVGETVGGEISIGPRGMSVEVNWRR